MATAASKRKFKEAKISDVAARLGFSEPKLLSREVSEFWQAGCSRDEFVDYSDEKLEKLADDFLLERGQRLWDGVTRVSFSSQDRNFFWKGILEVLKRQRRNQHDRRVRINNMKSTEAYENGGSEHDLEDEETQLLASFLNPETGHQTSTASDQVAVACEPNESGSSQEQPMRNCPPTAPAAQNMSPVPDVRYSSNPDHVASETPNTAKHAANGGAGGVRTPIPNLEVPVAHQTRAQGRRDHVKEDASMDYPVENNYKRTQKDQLRELTVSVLGEYHRVSCDRMPQLYRAHLDRMHHEYLNVKMNGYNATTEKERLLAQVAEDLLRRWAESLKRDLHAHGSIKASE